MDDLTHAIIDKDKLNRMPGDAREVLLELIPGKKSETLSLFTEPLKGVLKKESSAGWDAEIAYRERILGVMEEFRENVRASMQRLKGTDILVSPPKTVRSLGGE